MCIIGVDAYSSFQHVLWLMYYIGGKTKMRNDHTRETTFAAKLLTLMSINCTVSVRETLCKLEACSLRVTLFFSAKCMRSK